MGPGGQEDEGESSSEGRVKRGGGAAGNVGSRSRAGLGPRARDVSQPKRSLGPRREGALNASLGATRAGLRGGRARRQERVGAALAQNVLEAPTTSPLEDRLGSDGSSGDESSGNVTEEEAEREASREWGATGLLDAGGGHADTDPLPATEPSAEDYDPQGSIENSDGLDAEVRGGLHRVGINEFVRDGLGMTAGESVRSRCGARVEFLFVLLFQH